MFIGGFGYLWCWMFNVCYFTVTDNASLASVPYQHAFTLIRHFGFLSIPPEIEVFVATWILNITQIYLRLLKYNKCYTNMGNSKKNSTLGAAAVFPASQVIPQFLWSPNFHYRIHNKHSGLLFCANWIQSKFPYQYFCIIYF